MRRLLAGLLSLALPACAAAGPVARARAAAPAPTAPARGLPAPALSIAPPALPGATLAASPAPAPAVSPLPIALAAAPPADAPTPPASPDAQAPDDARVAGRTVSTRRSFAALRRLFGLKEPAPDPYAGALGRLYAGERVHAPEGASQHLDAATAHDLHLLGRQGLEGRLDKARTAFGSDRLRRLLTHPSLDAREIAARQDAAKELAADGPARAAVESAFTRHGAQADRRLFENVQGLVTHRAGVIFGLLNAVGAVFQGFLGLLLWTQPLQAVQMLLAYAIFLAQPMHELRALRADLLRYKAATALARELAPALSAASSERLRELGGVFSAAGDPAHPLRLAKTAASLSRVGELKATAVLDFALIWGPRTLWRPWRLVKEARERLAVLLGALGELDACKTLADLSREPGWGLFPAVAQEGPLSLKDGHHPLVLAARGQDSVPNDAALGGDARFTVLTGANMGGKSTFLRMVGQLQVLAQMGAPVPAGSMETAVREIVSSIDISDDLKSGKSLYDAETDRILDIVRRAGSSARLLVVMDEILQGTNPDDRIAIERAVVRYLARTGNLFLLATHNLAIAELEGGVPGVRNVHVEETVAGGKMSFSHKVLPGPASTRNAIATLEMKGYPAEITAQARADAAKPR